MGIGITSNGKGIEREHDGRKDWTEIELTEHLRRDWGHEFSPVHVIVGASYFAKAVQEANRYESLMAR